MTTHSIWTWALLAATLLAAGPPGPDTSGGVASPPVATPERFAGPPGLGIAGDPADTLYQTARAALAKGNFREAARLFRRIVDEEPGSQYAPDAPYWQAFALYRAGGADDLRAAVHALELQAERYPDAATRGDAEALFVRVQGELARRGDPEAAEQVARAARGAADCPEEEDDVRLAALNALMEMDPERAVPILERVLTRRDACSLQLRRQAVFIVAESETERATTILLDVARNDPDPEVRARAVHWLSEVETPEAIAALVDILRGSDDPQLVERALFALSEQGTPVAVDALREFAASDRRSEELREKAIFWLAETEDPRTLEFLQDLYGRLQSTALRERILYAASEAETERSAAWLLEIAATPAEPMEVRTRALYWAGETELVNDRLLALYDRVGEFEMKKQLLYVYAEMDFPASVEKLFEIARSEDDPELRRSALVWLAETDDPRVAEFLERIISEP